MFRVRLQGDEGGEEEESKSRFDPRMIIRRQVISGCRYAGGVMGKTVTLPSHPLWIHSIPTLVRTHTRACVRARLCQSWHVRVCVRALCAPIESAF